jgi:hypothetical protein
LIGLKRSHADVRSTNIYGNSEAHTPIITEAAQQAITRQTCRISRFLGRWFALHPNRFLFLLVFQPIFLRTL